ncbi:PREDICTED: vacuolar protein sorting-associated protein 72 homolog [Priapulus caudatus]|uniref:Vacuolar protein sorting-associated protein 72 homolog n=1 Tax=Priapulus caudatus TaxID=37621 RepID=A0ABM1EXM6_PRICU|nr:PREDICTED: vacuolar protein sorting-associated protein 72 homolog [Priapulus caudatus]
MAASREKRANAGNRMGRLLEEEEEAGEDAAFYATTYGGFADADDDVEYESADDPLAAAASDDSADSDISGSEDDEPISDDDGDDGRLRKKRGGVYTKAYTERPQEKKRKEEGRKEEGKAAAAGKGAPGRKKPGPKPRQKRTRSSLHHIDTSAIIYSSERKSVRKVTEERRKELQKRLKEQDEQKKKQKERAAAKRRGEPEVRRLTQEELLEEAKVTALENLKSLDMYLKMELEKKKARQLKQVYKGPVIRYHSVTMPQIEDISSELKEILQEERIDVDGVDTEVKNKPVIKEEKCARSFISFTDDKVFDAYFPQKKPKPPLRYVCPITRLPARYFDPITQCPYATLAAFKKIRALFYGALDQKAGDANKSPALQRWLEHRAKVKAEQVARFGGKMAAAAGGGGLAAAAAKRS